MASTANTSSGADEVTTDADELAETSGTVFDADVGAATKLPQHNFFSRLYTGTGGFEVVGRRKLWYGVGAAMVAIAVASILIRGFTFGIDFQGGTKVQFPRGTGNQQVEITQVEDVFQQALGMQPESVVIVGSGSSATVQIRSKTLSNDQTTKLKKALFDRFQPKDADGKPSISDSAVSETWGGEITDKALWALGVFLVLVGLYIFIRYELYMALSALATMCFDLTVTAGVYSLVGFEVTPATVIGLLTILGFSLYDTVIVFDKVEENTHGFQHTTRRTFAEQANLAVNQTFMRSINTSLISVLPVLALMVVAVWLLGVGTLKDLALVQLVGIIVGTYSSIFFATPLLVTLRERTGLVRTHTRRVLRRRNPGRELAGEDAEEAPRKAAKESSRKGSAKGSRKASRTGSRRAPAKTSTKAAKTASRRAAGKISDEDPEEEAPAETAAAEAAETVPGEAEAREPQDVGETAAADADTVVAPAKPAPGARPARPTSSRHRRPSGKRQIGRR